jgi:uncharacterized protein
MNTKTLITLLLCLITSAVVNAAVITTGNAIPALAVANRGELVLNGDEFSWQPWSTSKALGHVQVIQYLAPSLSSSKLNEPFIEALKARDFPKDKQVSVSIINMDDATMGSSPFVVSGMKSSKKKMPAAVMIVDEKGDGIKTWGLTKASSAIIVINKEGKVAFFKDGALTAGEITSTIKLIESLL